jgi:hypothetical protein
VADEGFEVYADFTQAQLATEEARKASLEQRGLAIVSVSGVMATLGFGSLALTTRAAPGNLPGAGAVLLFVGAAAFLIAAGLALAMNAPLRHKAVSPATVKKEIREHEHDDRKTALVWVTATRINLLDATRRSNNLKALLFMAAMIAEIAGIAALGSAVCLVILSS